MKLNAETRNIIGKERPWLLALMPDEARAFYVQLIDLETLDVRPDACRSAETEWYLLDRIFLIDGAGRVIGEVGKGFERQTYRVEWRWKKTFPFLERTEVWGDVHSPETVGGALGRIRDAADTRYVLEIRGRIQPIAILHKLPHGVRNLGDHLRTKTAEEVRKIRHALKT